MNNAPILILKLVLLMNKIILNKGDIFLTRSESLLGKLIRVFTKNIWESRTKVNHVGLIVSDGFNIKNSICIEALRRTKKHNFWKEYGNRKDMRVAIYRAKNLTEDEKDIIIMAANKYVGRVYGYIKILAHLFDWILFNAYLFRRIARVDKYPICSWLVAKCYAKANKDFGIDAGMASPDDIWDFIMANPDKYEEIIPLSYLR